MSVSSSSSGAGGNASWENGHSVLMWDEEAETVLLAWAVVDANSKKVIVEPS
jgi:hypothetical protein